MWLTVHVYIEMYIWAFRYFFFFGQNGHLGTITCIKVDSHADVVIDVNFVILLLLWLIKSIPQNLS